MTRPTIWVNDEECTTCHKPGRIDGGNYSLCVPCWCQVNNKNISEVRVQHVRERRHKRATVSVTLTDSEGNAVANLEVPEEFVGIGYTNSWPRGYRAES